MDAYKAHEYSSGNQKMLKKDKKCGCFYCLAIFSPDEIFEWIGSGPDATAICPYCSVDSVLSESAGYPLTRESLKEMHKIWFE
ncbi:hypothetical protein [Atopobacter phocae]|uniref:hypothetical protein n=1 Tax=Atopobacter phocae TaxID=136492 RepID=UPI00047040AA|nr:hypothetical protein [Atopobacter phocae]